MLLLTLLCIYDKQLLSGITKVTRHKIQIEKRCKKLPTGRLCICLRVQLYNNSLHNWVLLDVSCKRRIRAILYTVSDVTANNVDVLVATALRLGWTVLPAPRVNIGLPVLKDMYFEAARKFPKCAFYGFANADILFNNELSQTLQAVEMVCIKQILS